VITLQRSEVFPPPHRAFLFDLGVGLVGIGLGAGGESQNWLYKSYQNTGIMFDRIFAWEAKTFDPPSDAYKLIPAEMLDKMSFFNLPANCSGENKPRSTPPPDVYFCLRRWGRLLRVLFWQADVKSEFCLRRPRLYRPPASTGSSDLSERGHPSCSYSPVLMQ